VAVFTFLAASAGAQAPKPAPSASASAAPRRIVSTTPSITEILYALGLGDRVAGVTRFCRYPPEAQSKPKIGDFINPNLEAIAALRPDLVIVQTNPVRLSERLAALHLRSIEIDQQDVEAIYRSIRMVAKAAGVPERGERLNQSIREGLNEIQQRSAHSAKTRALFVVGRAPGRLDGLIVVGGKSYLSQLLSIAGGENVFSDAAGSYPQVSLEEVIARNPDVIIDMGEMAEVRTVTDATKRMVLKLWQPVAAVKAVRERSVFPVSGDMFVVPGPRAVNAAEAIFTVLHEPPVAGVFPGAANMRGAR
jgi:iron complex transport system substrate-binding protein